MPPPSSMHHPCTSTGFAAGMLSAISVASWRETFAPVGPVARSTPCGAMTPATCSRTASCFGIRPTSSCSPQPNRTCRTCGRSSGRCRSRSLTHPRTTASWPCKGRDRARSSSNSRRRSPPFHTSASPRRRSLDVRSPSAARASPATSATRSSSSRQMPSTCSMP